METPSTTFTVRVERAVKKRLEKMAKTTGRSRSYLAAEALNEYLDVNEWQIEGIKKAIRSLDEERGIAHKKVKEWVASWGGRHERRKPTR